MRLLHCSTQTLGFFIGSDVPPYAILSHTWEDEEVVHEDFISNAVDHTKKAGWYKIQMACDQTLGDGLEYLWADTLCIDKSSSSELSEAINSMFRWYRDSAICYAFLSDLPDVSLAECRWFTRGWTLQEMIAPKDIKFFDKRWDFLGTKSTLVDQLHQITKVDQLALLGGNLRLFSIAKRMSWAARRQTTRAEDIAYCLLGLFNIAMPMLYGEGTRAFIRLQEEIVKQYDDESLFAWKWETDSVPTMSNYSGLFAGSPSDFADSGDIVEVTHPDPLIDPVSLSSRGLRLVSHLQQTVDYRVFLLHLNCRRIHFDMEPGERLAIFLVQKVVSHPIYFRAWSNKLETVNTMKDAERTAIFCQREKHVEDHEMAKAYWFWLRTLPSCLQVVAAHPPSEWDEEHGRFQVRGSHVSPDHGPLVLVLRNTEPTGQCSPQHFIVLLGWDQLTPRKIRSSVFCDIQVRPVPHSVKGKEDWALQIQNLRLKYPTGGFDIQAQAEIDGLTLKCYTQIRTANGQPLWVADLHVKRGETGPGA